jgi:CheY-like chemotaxis protein
MVEPAVRPTPLRALVVDDEALARATIVGLLAGDAEVVLAGECGTGVEAAAAISAAPPDLLFQDIQMPEVDGFELCRQIRAVEAMRNIPVAFVTARRTAQDVKAGIAAGGNDFITKPFDAKHLMARIDRWVKQKQE